MGLTKSPRHLDLAWRCPVRRDSDDGIRRAPADHCVSAGEPYREASSSCRAKQPAWTSRSMTLKRSRTTGHQILRGLVLLASLAPLCALLWASGSDDLPAYSVNLSVIDEKNLPVPDATVEVRFHGNLIGTSTTSAAGKVTLPLKAAGSYSLTIKKQGYLPTETTLRGRQRQRRPGRRRSFEYCGVEPADRRSQRRAFQSGP